MTCLVTTRILILKYKEWIALGIISVFGSRLINPIPFLWKMKLFKERKVFLYYVWIAYHSLLSSFLCFSVGSFGCKLWRREWNWSNEKSRIRIPMEFPLYYPFLDVNLFSKPTLIRLYYLAFLVFWFLNQNAFICNEIFIWTPKPTRMSKNETTKRPTPKPTKIP